VAIVDNVPSVPSISFTIARYAALRGSSLASATTRSAFVTPPCTSYTLGQPVVTSSGVLTHMHVQWCVVFTLASDKSILKLLL
jgi:hypothetical protein